MNKKMESIYLLNGFCRSRITYKQEKRKEKKEKLL